MMMLILLLKMLMTALSEDKKMINKITDYELKNIIWYMNFYLIQKLKDKEAGKLLINELVFRLLKDKKQRENIELIANNLKT